MKKFFAAAFSFLFFLTGAFSFSSADIKIMTLENGLKIYFLEDQSSPVIRLEMNIKAGLSRQTEKNAGFFAFYAALQGNQIFQDEVKILRTVSPQELEKCLLEFSQELKPLHITDSELKQKLDLQKRELTEYYTTPAGFINSAIDSRLFPASPWKRSSGAVPALFNPQKLHEARSILNEIADRYYTPDKTSLFVSGNITAGAVLDLTEKYFGSISPSKFSSARTETEKKLEKALQEGKFSKGKKFVLYSKDFSPEMTQICVQYSSLEAEKCRLLEAVWNNDSSTFKKNLLKQRNLKILGSEYIDASSACDSMGSRLIIQSLLGAVKVSPVIQADLFLTKTREEETINDKMIQNALKEMKKASKGVFENSSLLMEKLSQYISSSTSEDAVQDFFSQEEILGKTDANSLYAQIKESEPWVFIFVNEDIFNKHSKEFTRAGYTVLNSRNSLWFNQKEYAAIFNTKENETKSTAQEDILKAGERFIARGKSEITENKLINDIPVVMKKNENTSSVEISLIIAGGDLLFASETPGLSSILTGTIAMNIKNQLDLFASNGAIEEGSYSVRDKTISTHSMINVLLKSSDVNFALQAMYSALIFCDVTPAMADMVTYDARTQWRLKSGTGEFQLLCEAMRILYKGTPYPKLFEDSKDKPAEMSFTKIMAAYPAILDATRYSFAITGEIKDSQKILTTMNKTFGTLETHRETQLFETGLPKPALSSKNIEKKLQLRHLFLTDIPKEKAGPMPAVLIPTKKFLDPVLFCLNAPDGSTADAALYDALLLELGKKMNGRASRAGSTSIVKALPQETDIPFARIVITNIERSQEALKIYSESLKELKDEIKNQIAMKTEGIIDLEKNEFLARLENNWIMNTISEAGTNSGTAELLKTGFIKGKPELYLEQYEAVNQAQLEDYFLIAESWFEEKPPLRLYSKDSK